MTKRFATIVHGPSVWVDMKEGEVLSENEQWVVVRLQGRDDAGHTSYDVRFPIGCVKIEECEVLDVEELDVEDPEIS